jgi:hypothetical protein
MKIMSRTRSKSRIKSKIRIGNVYGVSRCIFLVGVHAVGPTHEMHCCTMEGRVRCNARNARRTTRISPRDRRDPVHDMHERTT